MCCSAITLDGRSIVRADAPEWGRPGRIEGKVVEKGRVIKGENGRAGLTVYASAGTSVRGLSALRQARGIVRCEHARTPKALSRMAWIR